jgi:hypothetical protein
MTISWPRLLGVSSGIFGAAVTAAFVAQLAIAHSFRAPTFYGLAQLAASICGCVFLLLGFPLCRGREWARRALLIATYCIVTALVIFLFLGIFYESRPSSADVYPNSVRIIYGVCTFVCILTPAVFFLFVLHHPDVRRAFQTAKASNQALQPTAGRLENYKGEIRK